MKRVRGGTRGFTIVETLLFLGFSGGLLFSALLMIGGQNRKTLFSATVREFEAKIQSVVGNVSSGYYNTQRGAVNCTLSGGSVTNVTAVPGQQGQNADCVYVGQMFLARSNAFDIYSIVGPRLEGTREKDDLQGAKIFQDTVETFRLPATYSVGWVRYGGTSINSFAAVTTYAAYNLATNELVSGSSNTDMYVGFGNDVTTIDGNLAAGTWAARNPNVSTDVCITDGARRAIISLRAGTTRTDIRNGGCP